VPERDKLVVGESLAQRTTKLPSCAGD